MKNQKSAKKVSRIIRMAPNSEGHKDTEHDI